MTAGVTTINIPGVGNVQMWSSDGTPNGSLSPIGLKGNDEANQTTLASLLAAVQAQRSETVWTDNTGAYFVRNDDGGTVTWADITGASISAPGSGARPLASVSKPVAWSAEFTATLTGAWTQVLAANAQRRVLRIAPVTTFYDAYWTTLSALSGTTTAGGFPLLAGESFGEQIGVAPTDAIFMRSASGEEISIREGA